MNLYRKLAWFVVLLTLGAVYVLIHFPLKNNVVLGRFMELEQDEAVKNLDRSLDAIKREIHHLNKLAGDWAVWDDTYRFAQDGNGEFIASNLQMETLAENSGINLVYILMPSGRLVWGGAYHPDKGGYVRVPEFSDPTFERIGPFLKHPDIDSQKTGILITSHGPLLLSSRPILTSMAKGPSTGILVMGRFMTRQTIASLVDQTKVRFDVKGIENGRMTDDENALLIRLKKEPHVIRVVDDDHLDIFGLVADIFNRPGLLVHVSMERSIMDKGRAAARYVSGSLMTAVTLVILFLLFLVKVYSIDERRRTARVEALVEQRTLELKQANMEMEQARIAAVEASKAKSEFLANMSHEIRTPLNGVIGMTEIAMPTISNESQREIFETISREAHFLLGIINNILDFSKIEARKVEIESIPFDLHLLVSDIGKSQMFLCERKNLTCIVDLSPEAPRDVKGDPGRIRQILMNLSGNALKFTREGGIVIRCEAVAVEDETTVVKFSVTDTGIGIEKEKQDKIFESFTQVDGSTTRKYGGTGLGITISKQLAELMGGEMGIQSEFGFGSTFWFTVPLVCQARPLHRSASSGMGQLKALVVGGSDKEPLPTVRHLNGMGIANHNALTGTDALTLLRQEDAGQAFTLIIIDYLLADTDGFTLAADIRAMDHMARTPIILLTSVGNIGDGRRCEDIGIKGYLSMPVDPVLLKKAIRHVMDASSREQDGEKTELVTKHSIAEAGDQGGRILLVEDYPTNRQVAVNLLSMAGYEVDVAENGKEAVDRFLETPYALIFMDIQMPVMDGYEAARTIREIEAVGGGGRDGQRTPIVAMTANALTRDRENSLEAGMDDFITKPVTRATVLGALARWIGETVEIPVVEAETPRTKQTGQDGDLPLDYSRALSEFMDDHALLLETLDYFLKNCREQMMKIEGALAGNDSETVKAEAHKIKGGSANLAMDVLSAVAADLEAAGKAGDLVNADAHVTKIHHELDRLEVFLASSAVNP